MHACMSWCVYPAVVINTGAGRGEPLGLIVVVIEVYMTRMNVEVRRDQEVLPVLRCIKVHQGGCREELSLHTGEVT